MQTSTLLRADIVAFDAADKPLLIAEIRARRAIDEAAREQLVALLHAAPASVSFALLADLGRIQIFGWNGQKLSQPLFEASTAEVLSFYDAEFGDKEIFDFYLGRLIEAWLRDIAYRWKSPDPPASQEMERIGLAGRLQNGTTRNEVDFSSGAPAFSPALAYALHRD